MKNKAQITVTLEDDIKNNVPFNSLLTFEINKIDIFRLGALTFEPPEFIHEDDFIYLQSKVPALQEFFGDYITVENRRIVTHATGETATKVSEIIGVGTGLTYAVILLNAPPNFIKKIKSSAAGKTLDFEVLLNGKRYEIETRATSYSSKVKTMIAEVLAKKAGKPNTALRFGTVTLARGPDETDDTIVFVCDDNDEDAKSNDKYTIIDFLNYYKPVLSVVLDSHFYNILCKRIDKNRRPKKWIRIDKLKKRYEFGDRVYWGEAFDRRLIMNKIREHATIDITPEPLLRKLTDTEGFHQIFLGMDQKLIEAINTGKVENIKSFKGERFFEDNETYTVGSNGDGVVVLEMGKGSPKDLLTILPRDEVKTRLAQVLAWERGEKKPKCGAPCRSREIRGKPCEIRTYRGHCHFHR